MKGKREVALAASQLVGSILGLDTLANAATLASAVVGDSEGREQAQLRKSIQARLTMTMARTRNHRLDDMNSALDCIGQVVERLRPNDDLARAVASQATLYEYISHFLDPDHPAIKDPASRACLDLLLRELCDAVSAFAVRSSSLVPTVTQQTIRRIDRLSEGQIQIEDEFSRIENRVAGLSATVERLNPTEAYPKLGLASLSARLVELSDRPFLGRAMEMEAITNLARVNDCVLLSGEPMVGTTELAQRWMLQTLPGKPVFLLDCETDESYHLAVSSLSLRLEHGAPMPLEQLLNNPLPAGIIFDGVSSESVLSKILAAIERSVADPERAYIVTVRFRPSEPKGRLLEVDCLSPDNIGGLLETLLPHGGSLEALIDATDGLPLLAIQAASFIKESGLTPDRYVELLREQPTDTLRASVSIEARPKTAASIWDSAIDRARQLTGRDPRIPLGILREVGRTWPSSLVEATLGFFLSGGEELGSQAQVKSWLGILHRLVLIEDRQGRMRGTGGLLEYAWHGLSEPERAAIHNSVLRVARFVSDHARSSLNADVVGYLAHVLTVPLHGWADAREDLMLSAVTALANAFRESDYPTVAIWVLYNSLQVQPSVLSDSSQRRLMSILAVTLIDEERPEADSVAHTVLQAHQDAGSPLIDSTRVYIMMALLAWQHCDLAGVEAHLHQADSAVSSGGDDADQAMAKFNIARLRFQLFAASERGGEGLRELKTAIEILESLGSEIFLEDLLISSVQLLEAQGVAVPSWLTERGREAAVGALARQGESVPGHSVWYLASAGASSIHSAEMDVSLDLWLATPIQLPLDDRTNDFHNAFRKHVDVKRRIDVAEGLAVEVFLSRGKGGASARLSEELLKISDLIEEGLSILSNRGVIEADWRAARLQSTFWHHKGAYYTFSGESEEARVWFRRAYDFDLVEYGPSHGEVAYDAMGLANAWLDESHAEASKWAAIALRIFDSVGRHRDVSKASILKRFSLGT